jgi:adenylate kinase family enzyme
MRTNVTDNAGAGKSTLAKHIAQTLDIPLIEINILLWLPG